MSCNSIIKPPPVEFHFANVQSETDSLIQLGFTRNKIRFDAFIGKGDVVSGLRSQYSGMDPFHFHGGINQAFRYSGFAIGSPISKRQSLQLAHTTIRATGVADRTVNRFGYSIGSTSVHYAQVLRGGDQIGSAYSVGTTKQRVQFGYDYLTHNNGSNMHSAYFSTRHKGKHYQLQISASQNPLYSSNNESRVVFSLGFATSKRARWFNNAEAAEGGEGEESAKPRNKYLIGGTLVGLGVALSSGSSSVDDSKRFTGRNQAAFEVLNEINPKSVSENVEYGGYIYRNADGSFASTEPIRGDVSSVLLPPISSVVPGDAIACASYHTHAGPDPRFDNENFSPTDLATNVYFKLDGYLGTPAGAFKLHNYRTGQITTLGTIAN